MLQAALSVTPATPYVASSSSFSPFPAVVLIPVTTTEYTPCSSRPAKDPSGNLRTNTYQVTISGSSKTLTYDANGSLIAEGTKTYEWDGANRLVRVLDGGSELVRFVYDGQGRRSQKIAAGVTRTYVYDEEDIIEERPSAGATIRYVHGSGIDEPLTKRIASRRWIPIDTKAAGLSWGSERMHRASARNRRSRQGSAPGLG